MTLEACSPYYVLHQHLSALGILPMQAAIARMPVFSKPGEANILLALASRGPEDLQPQSLQSWNPVFTLSVPPKFVKNILDLDYIEMSELVSVSARGGPKFLQPAAYLQRTDNRNTILGRLFCNNGIHAIIMLPRHNTTVAYQQSIIKAHRT